MHSKGIFGLLMLLVAIQGIVSQETTQSPRRAHNRNRGSERPHRYGTKLEGNNNTGSSSRSTEVRLADADKYYESASSEDDDYTYEDYETAQNATIERDEEDKFIESADSGIVFDHVDFVLLRLKHISMKTSSNITEILAVQKKEFKVNKNYKLGWETAVKLFNESKRATIYNRTSRNSIIRTVPIEYHIALIAYTLAEPSVYSEFNKDTRDICSGTQIEKDYHWKSYFKLLQLAVETLGSQEARWMDAQRFLYRGASRKFDLKEGQVLAFQHFISTSSALTSAENFAGASLFEFQGFYNGTAMAIWDHSYYEHEREVLFSPLQVFEVDSIHVGTHYTRYVLIKHELPPPCDQKTTPRDENYDDITKLENINALKARSSDGGKIHNSGYLVAFLVLSALVYTPGN